MRKKEEVPIETDIVICDECGNKINYPELLPKILVQGGIGIDIKKLEAVQVDKYDYHITPPCLLKLIHRDVEAKNTAAKKAAEESK